MTVIVYFTGAEIIHRQFTSNRYLLEVISYSDSLTERRLTECRKEEPNANGPSAEFLTAELDRTSNGREL